MSHGMSQEALDHTLEDLRRNEQLLEASPIPLAGDLRQTLPVTPRGTPADDSTPVSGHRCYGDMCRNYLLKRTCE